MVSKRTDPSNYDPSQSKTYVKRISKEEFERQRLEVTKQQISELEGSRAFR